MARQFSNYGSALLAAQCASGAATVTVEAGTAALFPAVTTASGDTFQAVMEDTAGNWEVVTVTNVDVSGDILTITRAQEGTSAKTFATGSRIELRLTAAMCDDFLQKTGGTMSGDLSMGGQSLTNAVIDNPTILTGTARGTTLQNEDNDSSWPIVVPDTGRPTMGTGGSEEVLLTEDTGSLSGHTHPPAQIVGEVGDESFTNDLISEGNVTQHEEAVLRLENDEYPAGSTPSPFELASNNLYKKARVTGTGSLVFHVPHGLGQEGDMFFMSNGTNTSFTVGVSSADAGTVVYRKRDGVKGDVSVTSGHGVIGFHKVQHAAVDIWEVTGDYD